MSDQLEFIDAILHITSISLGILLIYYSIILLKQLDSEDFVSSMIFLHEKQIKKIFLIIAVGALFFWLGQTYYSLFPDPSVFILKLTAIFYAISLLYFVYGLQTVLKKGEENEYI
ncbi:MAG: hypothetical protein HVN35_08480 [Methanobacteriaceae archaeon]|nr:hypothetical protein [Methanobacteriaceae archaeon]